MKFDYVTLPFIIGLIFLAGLVLKRFIVWTLGLSETDRLLIWRNIRTKKTWLSIKESFREGLLHRKIFRTNPLLGYMHMSLAFGWFLLILVGHLETIVHYGSFSFPFYVAVFYKFFVNKPPDTAFAHAFSFTMDILLLFVLSGVALAYFKRLYKRIYGLKKTTRLKSGDKIALTSLWLIFPLRFLAESFTAGIHHNGSFLTQSSGQFFSHYLPLQTLYYPTWLAYSLSLGFFFIALPNSRYMHIPGEIFFIFLRNYGIKLKKRINSYSLVQVFSCSRCGICLDTCQLNNADIRDTQSVYVLKRIRNKNLTDETLFNCLLCGKCQQVCPVGIELTNLRITQRIESTLQLNSSYEYLKDGSPVKADVIYFAGCMTHLTPSIKKSMKEILDYARIDYWFMDEDKAPCCGRPLMQAGQYDAAEKLIINNRFKIINSGAKTLVVSCPICYKVFKEDYRLNLTVVKHHAEYILELFNKKRLPAEMLPFNVIYHDPCELGRGSDIYAQPRMLLENYVKLIPIKNEKEKSLCCGGSLSNIKIQVHERDQIRDQVLEEFQTYHPDLLLTSCPLCKKTFSKRKDLPVHDIAEIVVMAIKNKKKKETEMLQEQLDVN